MKLVTTKFKSGGLQVPFFLSDFNETCIFSIDFEEKILISNFMKICQGRTELFYYSD